MVRNRRFIFALAAGAGFCLWGAVGSAATFHVSPFGSNTPPYDTYAKAAHRIADAVAFADSGDTVLIGAGTYAVDSTIILARSFITVRGAGRDSTFILADSHLRICFFASGYDYSPDFGFQFADLSVQGGPSTLLFWLDGQYGYPGVKEVAFRRCRFVGEGQCIVPTECPLRVEECLFEYYVQGVAAWGKGPYTIRNNLFRSEYLAIAIEFKPDGEGPITIDHNTALGGAETSFLSANHCTDMTVTNNYVDVGTGVVYASGGGIQIANNFIAGGTKPGTDPYNNPEREVMVFYPDASQRITCENNSIIAHRPGTIIMVGPRWATGYVDFRYNALWGFRPDSQVPIHINQPTPEEPRRLVVDTTALIWADPMLAPDSTGALQQGSPLINAGNPKIHDVDGTRSDIGVFGGPWGSSYSYVDYPPRAPDSLQGDTVGHGFLLSWKPNSESDLRGYRVYRDTVEGFLPGSANLVRPIPRDSTTFLDAHRPVWRPLYYKVTAVDTASLESALSNEVVWVGTSLPLLVPREPSILAVYPNPSNSTVVIEYGLPDAGAQPAQVSIRAYNALGELVRTLYDGYEPPGRHRVQWEAGSGRASDLASGVYFVRLLYWGRPAGTKKVVLVK